MRRGAVPSVLAVPRVVGGGRRLKGRPAMRLHMSVALLRRGTRHCRLPVKLKLYRAVQTGQIDAVMAVM